MEAFKYHLLSYNDILTFFKANVCVNDSPLQSKCVQCRPAGQCYSPFSITTVNVTFASHFFFNGICGFGSLVVFHHSPPPPLYLLLLAPSLLQLHGHCCQHHHHYAPLLLHSPTPITDSTATTATTTTITAGFTTAFGALVLPLLQHN